MLDDDLVGATGGELHRRGEGAGRPACPVVDEQRAIEIHANPIASGETNAVLGGLRRRELSGPADGVAPSRRGNLLRWRGEVILQSGLVTGERGRAGKVRVGEVFGVDVAQRRGRYRRGGSLA